MSFYNQRNIKEVFWFFNTKISKTIRGDVSKWEKTEKMIRLDYNE